MGPRTLTRDAVCCMLKGTFADVVLGQHNTLQGSEDRHRNVLAFRLGREASITSLGMQLQIVEVYFPFVSKLSAFSIPSRSSQSGPAPPTWPHPIRSLRAPNPPCHDPTPQAFAIRLFLPPPGRNRRMPTVSWDLRFCSSHPTIHTRRANAPPNSAP